MRRTANRSVKIAGATVAGATVLVMVVAAYLRYAPRRTPAGQPDLQVLAKEDVKPFAAAFDAASDSIRIVALLSPT